MFLWVHYDDPHGPYTPPPTGTRFGTSDPDIDDAELRYADQEAQRLVEGLAPILGRDRTFLILTAETLKGRSSGSWLGWGGDARETHARYNPRQVPRGRCPR